MNINDMINSFTGSFFGAFFAFMSGILIELWKSRSEQKSKLKRLFRRMELNQESLQNLSEQLRQSIHTDFSTREDEEKYALAQLKQIVEDDEGKYMLQPIARQCEVLTLEINSICRLKKGEYDIIDDMFRVATGQENACKKITHILKKDANGKLSFKEEKYEDYVKEVSVFIGECRECCSAWKEVKKYLERHRLLIESKRKI